MLEFKFVNKYNNMKIKYLFFLVLVVSFTNSYAQQAKSIDLQEGLIVHFPFDGNIYNEAENLSPFYDESFPFVSNILKEDSTAIKFNNKRLDIDFYKGIFSTEYTVSFWFRPDEDLNEKTSDLKKITFLDSGSKDDQAFALSYFKGNIVLNLAFQESEGDAGKLEKNARQYPFKFLKNNWYLLCVTFGENNDIKLTIDNQTFNMGVFNTISSKLGKIGDFNKPLVIGGDGNNIKGVGKNFFNGAMDDLRIYNRILQHDEISLLFEKKTQIFPLPIVKWRNPQLLYSEVGTENFTIGNCITTNYKINKVQIFINEILSKEITDIKKYSDENRNCNYLIDNKIVLEEGANYIKVAVFDENGNVKYSDERLVINKHIKIIGNTDNMPPTITLVDPSGLPGFKIYTKKKEVTVTGNTRDESGIFNVKINGITAEYDKNTAGFKGNVLLNYGDNTIKVLSTDINKNESTFIFFVNREKDTIEDIPLIDLHEKRIALVIGNEEYVNFKKLNNPINDTKAIEKVLTKLDFDVKYVHNAIRDSLIEAIYQFGEELAKDTNTVGLFYYAGHGIQVEGKTYLVPVNAKTYLKPKDLEYCYPLETLLQALRDSKNRMNLIVLDACQNDPAEINRSFTLEKGLAPIVVGSPGLFVGLSTSPGMTASDGDGTNSTYTLELIKALKVPKLKVEELFKKVRIAVSQKTGDKQVPWENSSLKSEFYFRRN